MEAQGAAGLLASLLQGGDEAPALIAAGRSASRAQLREQGDALAAHLQALGLRRGDALAIWLPNGFGWLQALFAAARLGVLVVPISTRYKPPEVRHLLEVSHARAIIVPRRFLDTDLSAIVRELQPGLAQLRWIIEHEEAEHFLPCLADAPAVASGTGEDLLACFSTSGTTGHPKLATHGQASIVRHSQQVARAFDLRQGDALLLILPMFGVFGFIAMLAALSAGARVVALPVFDARQAADAVAEQRVTHVVGADSMFAAMLDLEGTDFSSWRRGVMADFVGLPLEVAQRGEARGILFSGTYGSSECYSLMSFQDWSAPAQQRAQAGGYPVDPLIEYRVVDPDSGAVLAHGEAGELQFRGPNVLAGYLNNPQASAKAFSADGWFRSGDLGWSEAGRYGYLARLGDSLRLRGYLVNPAEIESCLMTHPGVAGAQVVGVRRPGEGDVAVAYVIAHAGTQAPALPDEAELLAHCRSRIASYKVPLRIVAIDAFPAISGPNGTKIQKRQLRDQAQALLATPTPPSVESGA